MVEGSRVVTQLRIYAATVRASAQKGLVILCATTTLVQAQPAFHSIASQHYCKRDILGCK